MDKITIIKEKLSRLRATVTPETRFPEWHHRFLMNPPISEANLADAEAKYQITLPVDYRNFLLHVGNGGAGPGLGLYPFEGSLRLDYSDPFMRPLALSQEFLISFFARPFPHTSAWNYDWDKINQDPASAALYFSDEADFSLIQGSIEVCDYGCAIFGRLVVSGDERGNIWIDDRASDNGIYPDPTQVSPDSLDFTMRKDFFTWYDDWLNEELTRRSSRQDI